MDVDDRALLARFAGGGDAAAFEELVRRHGPLVLGVCRRVLRQEQDAEDAFQAVFVVLARKAAAIDGSKPLAGWLYGVALRLSLDLRSSRRSREERERKAARMRPDRPESEVLSVLDEELQRLPERYRTPFVLCALEGKTNDDAARSLGCPRGTVSTRLGKARGMLRRRLEERGVVVTGTILALLLGTAAAPAVPSALAAAAAHAAIGGAALSPHVAMLVGGGMKAMTAAKVKIAAVWMMVTLAGTSLGAVAVAGLAEQETAVARKPAATNEAKLHFEKMSALLRPLPGEYDWRDAVPWHVRIQAARKQAVKEDKPLLIFSCANACVLGRT
jgi:RNA polymerase sigma factor (sigma-70 family)